MRVNVGVSVGVLVSVNVGVGVQVLVAVAVPPAAPPREITTVSASPKKTPPASDIRQVPVTFPVLLAGAVIGTEIS